MQAVAGALLAGMAALYAVASFLSSRYPPAAYVRAFAEAAVVGGCADWFAVTALFRRPFGLPIPHTALIPRSKARIGAALGRFIVDNFLSARVLDSRLRQVEVAAWGGRWLQQPHNAASLAARLVRLAPQVAGALSDEALESLAASIARPLASSIPAAPTAAAFLSAAWSEARAQWLVDRSASLLADYLADHQEMILETVQAGSWRWMPDFVDKAIARRLSEALVQFLTAFREPDHPLRAKLEHGVQGVIARLAADPEWRARGETWKHALLDDPETAAQARRLWAEMRRRLDAPSLDGAALEARIAALLRDLGARLCNDADIQRSLNGAARVLVRRGLSPRREDIGRFVAQVVDGWDAEDVVRRLELQVGPDLQYIRVNGALVGGLVGLVLYSLARAFGG